MTTYSKRRGRRSLAAILAAMLIASVLAVVAGSPAQAANTSYEVLDAKQMREFAGQDRYDTALRLAKNFATAKGGLGAVPTVFVSSGETLVDSISVAGLAGSADAPILLTPTDSLHGGVADFLEDYGVGTVYVLGGPAAVSDAVVTAIEGLTSKPTVNRIQGDDRYATAAAIASMIDTQSSWCGSTAAGAVLINGATDAMPFGVAVQTTAFRLQLPVLMTAADELSTAAADFIRDNDIEHVQIIGGVGTVSADVASALTSLGVDTVARVEGDSASAVSVELAKLAGAGGACADALTPVSNKMVALVRGNPDGVVGAPVLASSLAKGDLVTPLVVGDSLPAVVSDYLAATPKTDGTDKLNLGIVAIGGTAAVSEATMSAALAAAASTGALTVAIGASTNTNGDSATNADDPVRPQTYDSTLVAPLGRPAFTLYFSDDVMPDLEKLRDVIEINGVPAAINNAVASSVGGTCDNRSIDVTLDQALNAGDTISVVGSAAHKFGTDDDQRSVEPASTMVQAQAPDRTRPSVTIIGIAGEGEFHLRFSDAGGFPAMTIAEIEASLEASGVLTLTAATGTPALSLDTGGNGVTAAAAVAKGDTSFGVTVDVARVAGATGTPAANTLADGDRLTLRANEITDAAGNKNSTAPGRAIAAPKSPRIVSVLMSDLLHSGQNTWIVDSADADDFGYIDDAATALRIAAKAGGDAAGAAGNAWNIVFDTASNHADDKPLDIDVRVDTRGKRVTVRFVNGKTTAGDLLAALKANSDFDARFDVGFVDTANSDAAVCSPTLTSDVVVKSGGSAFRNEVLVSRNAGRTQFAIEVNFSDYIATAVHNELLVDVLAATARRAKLTNTAGDTAAGSIRAINAGAEGTAAGGGLDLVDPADFATFSAPSRTVRYEATTAVVANLPMARDLVETAAGHQGAITARGTNPAITPVAAVATGYATDTDTGATGATTPADNANDKVDEDKNGASQVRIAVSSSVKKP